MKKEIITSIIVMPLIFAEIWFALAIGTVWENKIRCENGGYEFCEEK